MTSARIHRSVMRARIPVALQARAAAPVVKLVATGTVATVPVEQAAVVARGATREARGEREVAGRRAAAARAA